MATRPKDSLLRTPPALIAADVTGAAERFRTRYDRRLDTDELRDLVAASSDWADATSRWKAVTGERESFTNDGINYARVIYQSPEPGQQNRGLVLSQRTSYVTSEDPINNALDRGDTDALGKSFKFRHNHVSFDPRDYLRLGLADLEQSRILSAATFTIDPYTQNVDTTVNAGIRGIGSLPVRRGSMDLEGLARVRRFLNEEAAKLTNTSGK